jgi:hypothetical protein
LDIEESLAEEKKAFEALKKEHEALNKKCKVIESALVAATSELEAFQVNILKILSFKNGNLGMIIEARSRMTAYNYCYLHDYFTNMTCSLCEGDSSPPILPTFDLYLIFKILFLLEIHVLCIYTDEIFSTSVKSSRN